MRALVWLPLGGQFVQLAMRREDDDANVGVAQHRELPRLLQQSCPALAEGDLPVDGVLDAPQLHFAAHHSCTQPPTSLD